MNDRQYLMALLSSLVFASISCSPGILETDREAPIMTWDCTHMQFFWDAIDPLLCPKTKDDYIHLHETALLTLTSHATYGQVMQLVDSMPEHQSRREELLLVAMIRALCHHYKRRDGLVTLLSVRVPERIMLCRTEQYLAVFAPGPNPILVLEEAFFKSSASGARAAIVKALRRAFQGCCTRVMDDALFVRECGLWYRQHKNTLELNVRYSDGTGYPLFTMPERTGQSQH